MDKTFSRVNFSNVVRCHISGLQLHSYRRSGDTQSTSCSRKADAARRTGPRDGQDTPAKGQRSSGPHAVAVSSQRELGPERWHEGGANTNRDMDITPARVLNDFI